MMRLTVGQRMVVGFAIPAIILIAIGMISYRNTSSLIENNDQVTHAHEVLGHIELLLSYMKDVQTGARGYAIAGEDKYLEPYDFAIPRVDTTYDELKNLIKDVSQKRRLETLRPLLTARVKFSQDIVAASREQGLEAGRDLVKTGKGKAIFDEIRKLVAEMVDEENKLLHERDTRASASATLAQRTILVGTVSGLLIILLCGYLITRSITVPIREAVGKLTSTSSELLAGTTQQAAGAQEQAAAVSETTATVDEVMQTSEQGAQRAKGVGEAVQRTVEIGQSGRKAVSESLAATNKVKEQVELTAENILSLAEQAQAIGEIIATVSDIAEQTNLLALNAAIEASRAGEHGKGFSVVAVEVKALAAQSKKATSQVRQILGQIQKATNTAVLSTEEVTRGVAGAIRAAGQAGDTIKALTDTLADAAQATAQIVASAGQQAAGMSQIHQAIRNIDQVARQNLVATRQAEQAAQDLNSLGNQLAAMIAR
ncbi:MAG: CHASE3 domain-containing protein [Planctomycetota bacterium]